MKKYYNKELKERFITAKREETLVPKYYIEILFNNVSEFEEMLGKDVSCFTIYEISNFHKTQNYTNINSVAIAHSYLQDYTQWCLQQNLVPDCQNHFAEFNREQFRQFINHDILNMRIITRDILDFWIGELINPSDAFCLEALFLGINGYQSEELVNLKLSDIDIEKKLVHTCSGRIVPVTEQFISLAIQANAEDYYVAMSNKGEKMIALKKDKDLILRELPQSKQDATSHNKDRRLYVRLAKIFNNLGVGKWMRKNDVILSGKIHYINSICKEKGYTAKEFFEDKPEIKKFEELFNVRIYNRDEFCRLYKEHLI